MELIRALFYGHRRETRINTSAANTEANDVNRLNSSNYWDQNKSGSYLLHNKRLICKGLVQREPPTQICRKTQASSKSCLTSEQTWINSVNSYNHCKLYENIEKWKKAEHVEVCNRSYSIITPTRRRQEAKTAFTNNVNKCFTEVS